MATNPAVQDVSAISDRIIRIESQIMELATKITSNENEVRQVMTQASEKLTQGEGAMRIQLGEAQSHAAVTASLLEQVKELTGEFKGNKDQATAILEGCRALEVNMKAMGQKMQGKLEEDEKKNSSRFQKIEDAIKKGNQGWDNDPGRRRRRNRIRKQEWKELQQANTGEQSHTRHQDIGIG